MATKVQQAIETVSKTQSKVLMKNMIRISLSSICYHRDLFPPDCFSFRPYGDTRIIQLEAADLDSDGRINVKDSKAFLLTQWLEKGVFSAFDKDYISALTFAIFRKNPSTGEDQLLESYEFKFSFEQDQPSTINGVPINSKDDIKAQANKFIRNLISFTQTIEDLPKENWVTLQLKYTESTPVDYEPEFFKSTDCSMLTMHSGPNYVKIKLGSIDTPHVKTQVRFSCFESLLNEEINSLKPQESPGQPSLLHATSERQMDIEQTNTPQTENVSNFDDEPMSEPIETNPADTLKRYLQSQSIVRISSCAAELNYSTSVVRELFKQFKSEGILIFSKNKHIVSEEWKRSVLEEDTETITTSPPTESNIAHPPTVLKRMTEENVQSQPKKIRNISSSESNFESLSFSQRSEGPETRYGIIKEPIQIERTWKKERRES